MGKVESKELLEIRGILNNYPDASGLYAQFRFWVKSQIIGDWEDRIPLVASMRDMQDLCMHSQERRRHLFQETTSDKIFADAYDAFFNYDYINGPSEICIFDNGFRWMASGWEQCRTNMEWFWWQYLLRQTESLSEISKTRKLSRK